MGDILGLPLTQSPYRPSCTAPKVKAERDEFQFSLLGH